jgi:hypothetical protein
MVPQRSHVSYLIDLPEMAAVLIRSRGRQGWFVICVKRRTIGYLPVGDRLGGFA